MGVRIGDHVLDVAPVAAAEMLDAPRLPGGSLNPLMARGRRVPRVAADLADRAAHRRDRARPWSSRTSSPVADVDLHLPVEVADYVDFYASLEHATQRRQDVPPRRRGAARRTGDTCRSATTVGPARSCPAVRRWSGRRASGRRPTDDAPTYGPERPARHRGRARLRGRHPVGAGRPGRRGRLRRPRLRPGRPQRLVAPATSRRGSTCRWGRSSASRSPPRSPTG